MGELILVKHAAPLVVEHLPSSRWVLSESGKQQCEDLYSRLARYRPAIIYSSEEPKAVQTGEILASRLDVPFSPRRGLQENDRTNLPFFHDEAELHARMEEFFQRSSERVIGEESADEAHARFVGAIHDALASTRARPTVAVTHGAVISLLVARTNDLSTYSLWRDLHFTSFVVVSTPSFTLREVIHPTDR